MAFITGPQILRVKNAADDVVIAVARTLKFIGGIVVTDAGSGEAVIDGTGAAGNPWDVLGNAGGGLVLGTSTADSWDMIVNAIRAAGFDADGQFDVNGKNILALTVDPTAGAGVAATIGSIGLRNNAGAGQLWIKTGAAATAWTLSSATLASWETTGNALTGAGPTTPNEFVGSSNDYDVVMKRSGTEIMRLITDISSGLIIGGTTHVGTSAALLELQAVVNSQVISREVLTVGGFNTVNIVRQGRLDTVGAASGNVDFATTTATVQMMKVTVAAKQTGGATGAVGDGAAFVINLTLKCIAGVVTILDQVPEYTYAIDAGITAVASASGGSLRVTCTGVVGRNLRWGIYTESQII